MKKYLVIIPFILILIFFTRYFVFTKHIKKQNPLSYVYNTPIFDVRENIRSIFSNGNFHGFDFEVGYDLIEKENNKISDNQNKNHFFINRFAWISSGENSKIYYNWWGPLKLIPCYHITLDSISENKTKITIQSFPKVIAGSDFSLNHGLPYITSRKVDVKPSTIEEYEIIKRIGALSGEKNMPVIAEEQ
jgi:hypothetical protein